MALYCNMLSTFRSLIEGFGRNGLRGYATIRSGQPIHETRPHLVKAGDVTPGISAEEYLNRRYRVVEQMEPNSIAIVAGQPTKFATESVFYYFQQNNDLFYLTGWNEPNSLCILEKPSQNSESAVFHLLVQPSDPAKELWEGERTGIEGAIDIFNADVAKPINLLASHLQKLLIEYKTVYYDFDETHKSSPFDKVFQSIERNERAYRNSIEGILRENRVGLRSLKAITAPMRAIKSNAELRMMRLAGKISGRAYNEAYARHFKSEKGLQSFLEYRFVSGGCDRSSYIPVVAGGENALCIHYTRNDNLFEGNEFVLVDAAGSLGGYCADISRTWPVSGKFSPAQADLYEALLNVQRECIKQCTEDSNVSINDLHYKSVTWLTAELRNIGFHSLDEWEVMKYLYPHYLGHNLGLDVHDVPSYSRTAKIRKGQVITMEPGVYVPNEPKWPASYRGMGIRIEDDIAVGKDTYVILTVEAAKEIADIESIARNGVTTKLEEEVTDVYSL
ncbi:DEKNAAC102581 [Brettanomyces naardenensis]|uniref:DEKNAAC102581 n=1 Tax=Brettanomyces naardenensis TaxID=13370 RepID=A0A448YK78_BRENA|nr:DEKNAAC102581 [Brettanomyces naardenensis]